MTSQAVPSRVNLTNTLKNTPFKAMSLDNSSHTTSINELDKRFYSKNILINGRFLSQSMTGVQRYAHEVTSELNKISSDGHADITVCIPANVTGAGIYNYFKFRKSHFLSGYAWEQAILPFIVKGPLLNLCNLAPIFLTKQIVCIHDANVFIAPQSYSRNFRAFYSTILPLIAKRSQVITTVSQFSASQISRYFNISPAKISILPNGHEHVFKWSAKRSGLFEKAADFRPYILLLGSKAKHKNMSLIFGLAKKLDEMGLDIRVTGSASSIFSDMSLDSSFNHKNIVSMGHVSDDDLAVLFSNAVCLAFPSITEGFGIPIVEAMALGCPVISSNTASMPEVCGDAALLAAPDASELWLKHIHTLHTSSELRFQCIERGYQQVKKFTWKETAVGYLELVCQHFN